MPTAEEDSGNQYLALPGRLQVPPHQPRRRADAQRAADAGHLRRHGRLPRPGRPHDPDPQPREPLAPRRGHGAGPDRQALRPGRQRPRRQHQARRRSRPPAAGDLPGHRRHAHQLRRRHDAVGHVDHLRGDLQLRLDREQRHAGHRRAARLLLRGRRARQRPGLAAADPRRRPLLARGRGLVRRRAVRDRGPRRRVPLPLHARSRAEGGRRPGDLRRQARGARRARAAELRHGLGPARRELPDRVGAGRRAEPAHRHRPLPGAGQGRGDLQPHRGHLGDRQGRLLRLHERRRRRPRAALGAAPEGPRRRRAEADLRVHDRRGPRGPRQPRRRALDR